MHLFSIPILFISWLCAFVCNAYIGFIPNRLNVHELQNNAFFNQINQIILNQPSSSIESRAGIKENTPSVQRNVCLPWSKSINPSRDLSYMPMFTSQLNKIKAMNMEEVQIVDALKYCESSLKPARIGNLCFQNEKFRKIRMTYFDAGDSVQVFNSLLYPHYNYDLPMLGIDLISLGKSRVLSVVDFQPLYPTAEYSQKYIEQLSPIRNRYPDLQGTLSGKIYDDTSFFSKNMLFGRFTDESKLDSVLKPAFNDYLEAYFQLAEQATPTYDPSIIEATQNRQAEYDTYSAIKDPAVGLFDAYFGKQWSEQFVHEFLFDLSGKDLKSRSMQNNLLNEDKNSNYNTTPVHNFQIDKVTGEIKYAKKMN